MIRRRREQPDQEQYGENYARDSYTDENDNRNEKYDTNGESQYSRFSSRPLDMDPRTENRQYDLREFQGRGHVGRGPKGYHRSDNRIYEDVCEALLIAPEVDASEIEVTVMEGNVHLVGSVENRRQKKAAEAVVELIAGVMDIINELKPRKIEFGLHPKKKARDQFLNSNDLS